MESRKFPKSLRLTGKKNTDLLFNKGRSFLLYPYRVITLPAADGSFKVLFTVPARTFRKATDRNRIRRRMRESFRLERHHLSPLAPIMVAYIYVGKELLPSPLMREKMIQTLGRLSKQ